MAKIVVIDGQGGRLGKLLVEEVKARLPQAELLAVGTNGIASSAMQKAGASQVATGENPVVRGVMDADVVLGPLGIVVAHAILGEVTPKMAEAVGGCRAKKFLVPMNSCGVVVAGVQELSLSAHVRQAVDRAVEFLLDHWTIRKPIGPCHYGIGTLFMQVEYPFRNYNLFEYVYVLSFYERARKDARFLEAFHELEKKTVDGQIVVERVVPKLAKLAFCKKGEPSELATRRFGEIQENLAADI